MSEELNNDIPKYLEEFLEPTRSSIEKLLAAFDGLSVETQIKLLSTIEGKRSQWEFPNITYLYKKVFLKAFESPNSYVRYLSVRNLVSIMYGDDGELNNFIAKVDKDKSSLVRSARYEIDSKHLSLGEGFFTKQTHDERLAKVRKGHLDGKSFAGALKKAAKDKYFEDTNTLIELIELLDEYLRNDYNNSGYYMEESFVVDGWIDHSEMKELKELWDIVPKLPDLAGRLLVQKLPHSSKMGRELYKNILNDLTDEQLECLLMRDDIRAEEFRKELFWRDEIPNDNEDEFMPYREFWSQASLYHFKLNEEEFARILSLPPKEQQKRLESLSQAHSLELYQYLAIIQLVTKFDTDSYDNFYIHFAKDELKKRLNQEPEFYRDEQLIKLRLYDLAYKSRNWRNFDDLVSYEELLFPFKVGDDTWRTFLAFIVAFKESKLTLEYLPRAEYEEWEEEEEEIPLEKPLASELSQLNSLISTTRDAAFQNRLALAVIAGLVLISVIF